MPRLVALPALLVALVAAGAAPVPDVKGPVYFPTKVGAKWVVRLSGRSDVEPYDRTYAVTAAVTVKDGVTAVTYGREVDGRVRGDRRMLVSRAGLAEARGLGRASDPPAPLLKTPLITGASWAWKGTFELRLGGGRVEGDDWSMVRTVKGAEEVVVPAGRFTALKVEATERRTSAAGKTYEFASTEWHVKDIGRVKWVSNNLTEVMVSFTPGRD